MTTLTVTATQGGSPANGMGLRVLVITGALPVASQTGGSAGTNFASGTSYTVSVTTTQTGSRVYGACSPFTGSVSSAAAANTTIIDNFLDATNTDNYVTFKGTSTTGTPGATSFGVTNTANAGAAGPSAYEVLAAATLAEDGSGPAFASTTTAQAVTTASFTPVPGSLLVALVAADGGTGSETMSVSDNLGSHLNWTEKVRNTSGAGNDYNGVWIADVPAASGGGGVPIPWQYLPHAAPGEPFTPWIPWQESPVPAAAAAAAPVYPLRSPVCARPGPFAKGRVTGSSDGTFGQAGPPVYPLHGPVSARRPSQLRGGRATGSQGAPVSAAPPAGAAAPPLRGPVRTRPQPPPRGRAAGNDGVFSQAGPRVYALRGPVRTRPQPPPAGAAGGSNGLYCQAGPPVTALDGPIRARFPLPQRGRAQGRSGAFTQVAIQSGPPVYPLRGPVRTRPQPPPRGRAAGNDGVFSQAGPKLTPLRGPVCARQPLPRRGRCAGSQGTYTAVVIGSGPPVYPLRGPVRTRPQPPPRGRCAGNRGVRHQTGPAVTPLRGPVAPFRPGPYRPGRTAGNDGVFSQTGPRVTPLRGPVAVRRPGPFLSGRCIVTFTYRPPAPPPAFQVARSTSSVTDPRDGTDSVTDPRDGTDSVTAMATSTAGVS